MPTNLPALHPRLGRQMSGVTLIETIVFIVVMSIAMGSLFAVFNQNVTRSVDPVVRVQALEKAQSLLAGILARKFDENTPTGGIPACGTTSGAPCAGISADPGYDDVGDYHGFTQSFAGQYSFSVAVVEAGAEIGLPAAQARRVTVTISMPDGNRLMLSAYKVNF